MFLICPARGHWKSFAWPCCILRDPCELAYCFELVLYLAGMLSWTYSNKVVEVLPPWLNKASQRQLNISKCWSGKKRGTKVFNWSEVYFYRSTSYKIHTLPPSSNFENGRKNHYGTIHLRCRHALGGEGSKICQICRRIVLKNCRR